MGYIAIVDPEETYVMRWMKAYHDSGLFHEEVYGFTSLEEYQTKRPDRVCSLLLLAEQWAEHVSSETASTLLLSDTQGQGKILRCQQMDQMFAIIGQRAGLYRRQQTYETKFSIITSVGSPILQALFGLCTLEQAQGGVLYLPCDPLVNAYRLRHKERESGMGLVLYHALSSSEKAMETLRSVRTVHHGYDIVAPPKLSDECRMLHRELWQQFMEGILATKEYVHVIAEMSMESVLATGLHELATTIYLPLSTGTLSGVLDEGYLSDSDQLGMTFVDKLRPIDLTSSLPEPSSEVSHLLGSPLCSEMRSYVPV